MINLNYSLLTCCVFNFPFAYCYVRIIFMAIITEAIIIPVVMGYCMSCVGGVRTDNGAELAAARQTVVGVASANGVAAIDMVSTNFSG